MDIQIDDLKNGELYTNFMMVEEVPELMMLGCLGKIKVSLKVCEIGDDQLLEGFLKGEIKLSCRYCNDGITSKYQLPLKILLTFKNKKGIEWDEEVEEIDNYCISVGFHEPRLSIISIIREQILLNLNPDMSSEYVTSICSNCKVKKNAMDPKVNISTNWDELKKIKFNLQQNSNQK